MADSGILTLTGDGEQLLSAFETVVGIVFYLDTPTDEIDYLSTTAPRRIMHAGWIGLGSGSLGVAGSTLGFDVLQVSWWTYFDHEANARTFDSPIPFIDRVIYHFGFGVVAKCIVYW